MAAIAFMPRSEPVFPVQDTLKTSLCAPQLFPTADGPEQGILPPPM